MKISKSLLAVASFLISTQIQAAPGCTATNLNGNYAMYQNSVSKANPHIGSCKVAILNGVLSGTCAFTANDANGGIVNGFNGPVTGTASINQDCSAGMQINFSPAANVNIQSFFTLQFTPDKQSFIGQWTNSFGLLGTTAGTRYVPSVPTP